MGNQVKEAEVDLDSLLRPLGGFGKFQIINCLALSSLILLSSYNELSYVFTAAPVKLRCLIPECESSDSGWDDSSKPWLSAAIPATSSGAYDSCLRYNNTLSQCTNGSFSRDTYQCNAFVYETEEWTIAREDWGLDCDSDRYFLYLVGSVSNAGQMFGSLYSGYLADRYGRKTVLLSMAVLVSITGVIKSFSVSYLMMISSEAVEALLGAGLYIGPFVLAIEIVDPSKRALVGTWISIAYPLGEFIMGLVQYLTLEWRTTIRILYAPFILSVAYFWIVPESVRWLLETHRTDKAVTVLRRIAQTNGRQLPEVAVNFFTHTTISKVSNGENKKSNFLELWRSKRMRYRTAVCWFIWLSLFFTYFGMTLNSVNLNDDKFLNFILQGMIEVPACLVTYLVLDRWGRRNSQSGSCILCGVACLLNAYIPKDDSWRWAALLIYLTGKFGVTIAVTVVHVYTSELFPTRMRSSVASVGVSLSKLSCIVIPQLPVLSEIYEPLPFLLIGGVAIASGLTTATLPETLNCKLPDTMEEAEDLGLKKQEEIPLG